MGRNPIGLFDAFDILSNPYEINSPPIQEIIIYCETRFRAALPYIADADPSSKDWMLNVLYREVVSNSSMVL